MAKAKHIKGKFIDWLSGGTSDTVGWFNQKMLWEGRADAARVASRVDQIQANQEAIQKHLRSQPQQTQTQQNVPPIVSLVSNLKEGVQKQTNPFSMNNLTITVVQTGNDRKSVEKADKINKKNIALFQQLNKAVEQIALNTKKINDQNTVINKQSQSNSNPLSKGGSFFKDISNFLSNKVVEVGSGIYDTIGKVFNAIFYAVLGYNIIKTGVKMASGIVKAGIKTIAGVFTAAKWLAFSAPKSFLDKIKNFSTSKTPGSPDIFKDDAKISGMNSVLGNITKGLILKGTPANFITLRKLGLDIWLFNDGVTNSWDNAELMRQRNLPGGNTPGSTPSPAKLGGLTTKFLTLLGLGRFIPQIASLGAAAFTPPVLIGLAVAGVGYGIARLLGFENEDMIEGVKDFFKVIIEKGSYLIDMFRGFQFENIANSIEEQAKDWEKWFSEKIGTTWFGPVYGFLKKAARIHLGTLEFLFTTGAGILEDIASFVGNGVKGLWNYFSNTADENAKARNIRQAEEAKLKGNFQSEMSKKGSLYNKALVIYKKYEKIMEKKHSYVLVTQEKMIATETENRNNEILALKGMSPYILGALLVEFDKGASKNYGVLNKIPPSAEKLTRLEQEKRNFIGLRGFTKNVMKFTAEEVAHLDKIKKETEEAFKKANTPGATEKDQEKFREMLPVYFYYFGEQFKPDPSLIEQIGKKANEIYAKANNIYTKTKGLIKEDMVAAVSAAKGLTKEDIAAAAEAAREKVDLEAFNEYAKDKVIKGAQWIDSKYGGSGPGAITNNFAKAVLDKLPKKHTNTGDKVNRGWRNNNPGNIRAGSFATKQGAKSKDKDNFAIFSKVEDGIIAMNVLITNGKYTNLNLAGIINRYAPPSDGNNTSSYISSLASKGVRRDIPASQMSENERILLIASMIMIESGPMPTSGVGSSGFMGAVNNSLSGGEAGGANIFGSLGQYAYNMIGSLFGGGSSGVGSGMSGGGGGSLASVAQSFVGSGYSYSRENRGIDASGSVFAGATSMDCSSFVAAMVYKSLGIPSSTFGANTAQQIVFLKNPNNAQLISKGSEQAGDIVMYYASTKINFNHVAIVVSSGRQVHMSSGQNGIVESNIGDRTRRYDIFRILPGAGGGNPSQATVSSNMPSVGDANTANSTFVPGVGMVSNASSTMNNINTTLSELQTQISTMQNDLLNEKELQLKKEGKDGFWGLIPVPACSR